MSKSVCRANAVKSSPYTPPCYRARSDRQFEYELEVAAKNAEINRSIEVPREENDGLRNRVGSSKKTVTYQIPRKEYGAFNNIEQGLGDSQFPTGPLQSSIHNIIDEWSSAVLSIFSEKQSMNQDRRAYSSNALVAY